MQRLVRLLLPILSIVSFVAFFALPWFAFGSDTSTAWHNLQWALTEQGNRLYIVMVLVPLATIVTLILSLMPQLRKRVLSDAMMLLNGLALLPFGYYYYDLLTTYNVQQQKLFNPVNHIQIGFWVHLALVGAIFVLTVIYAAQRREPPDAPTEEAAPTLPETQSEQAA